MITKVIAALALPAALAIVFYLTNVPAWAWVFVVAVVAVEAAMLARAHRIDSR